MDGIPNNDDRVEQFYDELDDVFVRHKHLIRERPDMIVALLINMADGFRSEFGVTVNVEPLDDDPTKTMVTASSQGNEAAGFLGFPRDPETGDIPEDALTDSMEYVD